MVECGNYILRAGSIVLGGIGNYIQRGSSIVYMVDIVMEIGIVIKCIWWDRYVKDGIAQ